MSLNLGPTSVLTLLEICSYWFDKNESRCGWAWRDVPYKSADDALRAYEGLIEQATRLHNGRGEPLELVTPARGRQWKHSLRISVADRLVRVQIYIAAAAHAWSHSEPLGREAQRGYELLQGTLLGLCDEH